MSVDGIEIAVIEIPGAQGPGQAGAPSHGVPRLAGTTTTVAEVVRTAYDHGLDAATALAVPAAEATTTAAIPSDNVPSAQVQAALAYCADRRCDADNARCPSCRLWTEAQGITSLETFCARYARIEFAGSGITVSAPATSCGSIANESPAAPVLSWPGSLEDLARNWAGEEYWFIARRVQRRHKHKTREGKLRPGPHSGTGEAGSGAPGSGDAGPVFILVEPQMADNIGMVARAMANFAVEDLRLVAPRDGWPNDKARFAASGAHPVIDAATVYTDTKAAMADLTWVCATTARPRQLTKPVMTPDEAISEMIRRMAAGERCGVLFGPERTGLSTDDVADADAMVMVRVNPTFASLNLAQAVLLMSYEWLKQTGGGTIGRHTAYEGVAATGLQSGSPPATKADLLSFFEHLEEELLQVGHFRPPEKRQTMVRNLRAMFERMGATRQEVRTLRGVLVSLTRSRHTGADHI